MRRTSMTRLSDTGTFSATKSHRLLWPIVLMTISILCLVIAGTLLCIGRWLVVEDPLDKVPAIVVLSGRMPVRAIEAAKLYRAGYAAQIWLTCSHEPTASLQALHIAYIGEDFYNARVLMHEGVPSNAIHVLEPSVDNTVDEVRVIIERLARENASAVIIVTTKAHTRRVRTLWNKLSDGHRRAIVRAAGDDPFEPAHWWRTSSDVLDVTREGLGVMNSLAGLPLRPATEPNRK